MTTKILDPANVNITGIGAYSNLRQILADDGISMTESMVSASTVEVTVADIADGSGLRPLLSSQILASNQAVTMSFDDMAWNLCKVAKLASILTLTFEPDGVAKLRKATTPMKVPPNTMSRVQFCTNMAEEVGGLTVIAAPDIPSLVELARGTFDSDLSNGEVQDDPENSWDAMARIMGEIGWRSFNRRSEIILAPDSWLLEQSTPILVTENEDGIDNIDFDWDIGKPVAEAEFTCRCGFADFVVGSVVNLGGMGPASTGGPWLVSEVERSAFSLQATVSLMRQRPVLDDPGGTADTTGAGG